MEESSGFDLRVLVGHIRENPGVTQDEVVDVFGVSPSEVRAVIVEGRHSKALAPTFRGYLVLRSTDRWDRPWSELSSEEQYIIRRIRSNGKICTTDRLGDVTGWSSRVCDGYFSRLRKDNILVRNDALFLGPNSN